jgi:glycosyltransferase involved in cell wall biosynthesis
MIIYATMAVKNEADILSESIEHALRWADKIFVVDNESEDGTPKILKQFGNRVVLLATFHGEFREGIKSIPFNWVNTSQIYPRADWWCVMDADEVYHEDPRAFLKSVPPRFGRVCTNTIELIGLNDIKYPLRPESYSHYMPLDWSESRFYRNIRGLRWHNYKDNGPSGVGATYHRRIQVLHFPFRTEEQIKKRMATRNRNRKDSGIAWHNANYESVGELMGRYNAEYRRSNTGLLEFSHSARNFLYSSRDNLTRNTKLILHSLGFYR